MFGADSGQELAEGQTKIEHIQEINPGLVVSATVVRGSVENQIQRDFSGEYSGSITSDEFTVTYLNQGYIDRTARDPEAVSQLIAHKMDRSNLDEVRGEIDSLKEELGDCRSKYLKKFLLLEEEKALKSKLAEVKKFFDVSNSKGYRKLVKAKEKVIQKEQEMQVVQEELEKLVEIFERYGEELGAISVNANDIERFFPSLAQIDFPDLNSLWLEPLKRVKTLISRINKSKELTTLAQEKTNANEAIQNLFKSEGINYTKQILEKKEQEQQSLEKQLKTKAEQIKKCDESRKDFDSALKQLSTKIDLWNRINSECIDDFNKGISGVEVRYDAPDKEAWLISVLTKEVKQGWEEFTPQSQKAQKFKQIGEEDLKKLLIESIKGRKKCGIDGVVDELLESLNRGKTPVQGDYEFTKWLFGDRSEVINEFLKLRLKEFAEQGMHQVYYDGKNISKEGLSFTERCGALLEIILEKGDNPLIMDQPEENLGSSYITKTLINRLLEKKSQRQILLVSHNPNSVVLADSDLIVAFDRENETSDRILLKNGAIESTGLKEVICDIIEGGKEAFDLRSRRYKHV